MTGATPGGQKSRGGSSSDRAVELEYWLCPLPPAGTVTFGCEGLDPAIPFSTRTLDAEVFRSAARRSHPLWP